MSVGMGQAQAQAQAPVSRYGPSDAAGGAGSSDVARNMSLPNLSKQQQQQPLMSY